MANGNGRPAPVYRPPGADRTLRILRACWQLEMLNKVLFVLALQLCSAAEFAPAIDLQVFYAAWLG